MRSARQPIPRGAERRSRAEGKADLSGEMIYTETFCAAAMQDFVGKHPEAIARFLRALVKAERFVHDQPVEARRLIAEFIRADKAILDRV